MIYILYIVDEPLKVFNTQYQVEIGGGSSQYPFIGNITGFVLNGINIFSESLKITGDAGPAGVPR